jgi:hypothetical protein
METIRPLVSALVMMCPPHLVLLNNVIVVTDEGVSKSFRTESIKKYTLTTINTR